MMLNQTTQEELIRRCDVDPPDYIIHLQLVLCLALSLISIAGNALVLIAIYRYRQLHKPTNYFLASLALADLFVGLVMGPLWSARLIRREWPEDRTEWGKCVELFTILTLGASTYSLCAVSFDRYFAIRSPFVYAEYMTKGRCLLAILLIWIFAISFGCCRLFFSDPFDLPNVWLVAGGVVIFIPFSIIGYSYYHIFKIARIQARRIAKNFSSYQAQEPTTSMRNMKANITIAIIIAIFLLCWIPAFVVGTLEAIYNYVDFCAKIRLRGPWVWIFLMCMLNSSVNPWIYAIRAAQFRIAFKQIICWWRKNRQHLTKVTPTIEVQPQKREHFKTPQ